MNSHQETSRPLASCYAVRVSDSAALRHYFMQFVHNGGLFIPVERAAKLGDELLLLLHVREESAAIAGRVVWLTPAAGAFSRPAGIGVQFTQGGSRALELIRSCLSELSEEQGSAPVATL